MTGNHCGHLPENPSWFLPPENHKRPAIINEIIVRIRQYYANPAQTIPSLDFANGSERQQRSERREACCIVMGCLLHYLDLATMRVGIPQQDLSFKGITMDFIADKCHLNLRRVERAVGDLVEAGILTVHALCEKISDVAYKGYAAIRTIDIKLFTLFSLAGRLRHEREKASERQRKKNRKSAAKEKAKVELVLKKLNPNFGANPEQGSNAQSFFKAAKEFFNSA